MSYTEMFGFDKNGNAYPYAEIDNSWRSLIAVWEHLVKKYLNIDKFAYHSMKEIDELIEKNILSEVDKICLYTTFDNVLVKKEDMLRVIDAFRKFDSDRTSLKEQADILEEMLNNDDCIAVGWNQTSVNDDIWYRYNYDEETESYVPYNCLTGNKHIWLFHNDECKIY